MSQQNQSSGDQSSNLFWMIILICGVFLAVWWLKREWVVVPISYFRYFELIFLHYVVYAVAKFIDIVSLHHWHIDQGDNMLILAKKFVQMSGKKEHFSDFMSMNKVVGIWIRYPTMIILAVMAWIAYYKHGTVRFRQEYTMSSLRKLEVENWPQIAPVVSLDLVKEDLDTGPWAMAMTPLDFGKKHGVLYKQEISGQTVWGADEKVAGRIFSMQLGQMWLGVDRLPIHGKALLVIFLASATKSRAESRHFLAQISASSASGKLNFAGVEEALQKYKNNHVLQWVLKRHGYNCTVLATLLELARTDGVLASSEFLWLKPVDRRLWYMLNSVGRQTAVVEMSGAFSHWLAEKKMKRPLKTPVVKEAVAAYRNALEDILFIDEKQLWHSNEA